MTALVRQMRTRMGAAWIGTEMRLDSLVSSANAARKICPRVPRHQAPIETFSVDDVWAFLLQNQSPWGADNRDLLAMYRNAQAGECPLVVDKQTESCGNSRFGCWVCTVVTKDKAMEALVENGEEWLEPLLDLRDELAQETKARHSLESLSTIRLAIKKEQSIGRRGGSGRWPVHIVLLIRSPSTPPSAVPANL